VEDESRFMRILFLSAWFPFPLDSGSKIRVYHLLQGLVVQHQVSLVSFCFGTADPNGADELRSLCEEVRVVKSDPFQRGDLGTSLRFLSPVPIVTRPLLGMSRLAQQVLGQDTFDLIVASTEVMAAYALQAPPGMVKVLEEHNSMTRWMRERYLAQRVSVQRLRCWLSWQKARAFERRLLRRFDLCTMVSEQDRAASQALLPPGQGRIEVVPNGVDCEYNHPGLADPKPGTLVYNGSLNYSANYDAMEYFLARIYPLIQHEESSVSLTITGSLHGVDLAGLRLDQSVYLSGHVLDVRPLVAEATVCVVPIRQGGGTRLKILEAMALGTPVVATPKGAEGLSLSPGKDILLASAPEEFVAQVLRLLHNPSLRDELSHNARCTVEQRYDWSALGRQFAAQVEAIARDRGSA
jgi:glycosyltransferase involved in cell wall biosynthesis